MSLSGAAQALGLPEALVKRSAEARAAESGASVEEILAAWAGGESVAAASPQPVETEPVETAPAETPEGTAEDEEASIEPVREQPIAAASASTVGRPAAVPPTRAPLPAQVTLAQAAHLPEVITVPTAGIRERTNFAIPRWLSALMLIAPLFALFALGGSATGSCGEATELTTDVITGEIENCDGSAFTGGGPGGGGTDFVGLGGAIYTGSGVAGVNCAGCHGASGQGSGAFPALTGALTTFGACADHIEWVALGSTGFQARGDSTYGDTGKAIQGGMPSHSNSLTEEQIASVAAYERVRFGGGDPGTVLVDCGLVAEEPGAEGGAGEDVEPGTTETTTTETEPEAAAGHSG
jgi:mono/diheme cytochrome c family protein